MSDARLGIPLIDVVTAVSPDIAAYVSALAPPHNPAAFEINYVYGTPESLVVGFTRWDLTYELTATHVEGGWHHSLKAGQPHRVP